MPLPALCLDSHFRFESTVPEVFHRSKTRYAATTLRAHGCSDGSWRCSPEEADDSGLGASGAAAGSARDSFCMKGGTFLMMPFF